MTKPIVHLVIFTLFLSDYTANGNLMLLDRLLINEKYDSFFSLLLFN